MMAANEFAVASAAADIAATAANISKLKMCLLHGSTELRANSPEGIAD